jgi:hypothetical protein
MSFSLFALLIVSLTFGLSWGLYWLIDAIREYDTRYHESLKTEQTIEQETKDTK